MTYLKRVLLALICIGASYSVMAAQAEAYDTVIVVCDAEEQLRLISFSASIGLPDEKTRTCASILKAVQAEGFNLGTPITSNGVVIYTLTYRIPS